MAARKRIKTEKKERFLEVLRKTGNISEAARDSGNSRRVWYMEKEQDEEFAQAWEQAVEEGVDALEAEARRRAYDGVDEPVFYKGEQCGYIRKYSDTLLIFLLKGARPKKYAEFHRVEGGDQPIRVQVVKFSDGDNPNPK